MKRLVLILTGIAIAHIMFAQDVIVLRTGDEINARIVEVGTSEIKYKKFENLQGPNYSIEKFKVFMIRYENGSKDVFKDEAPATASSSQQTTQTKQSSGRPLPGASFNVNPLGLLQFGPIIQLETKIAPQTYLTPHFRYAFLGLLTHISWLEGYDNAELNPTTAGIGLGVKGFAQPAGSTWYYGGMLDYSWTTANWDIGSRWETEEKSRDLAVISNFGYRWRSEKGSYINVGLLAGAAFTISDEERYVSTGELYATYSGTTPFAMLELSFGLDFK